MKKVTFALFVLVSFFSCNNVKNNKDISAEKDVEIQTGQEAKSEINLDDISLYEKRGLEYALNTQAVLGKNLMQAIQKDGTLGALTFCNEKAYPLTDSMAVVQQANIKRISDKPRNQDNQASNDELQYIETFKQIIAAEDALKPIVKESDTKVQVYYPILTNAMCLQCHGEPNKNIAAATLKKLTILYPRDKAIGYDVNEVRGIWRVTFDK